MAWSNKYKRKRKKPATSKSTSSLAVLPIAPLSEEEEHDLLQLERKVERAFFIAGSSLKELRDRRLYRVTHATFEEYCRDRFNFTRQAANYLIAGALVFENLTTIGYTHHNVHNVCRIEFTRC